MDDNETFLREFIKARHKKHVSKIKLKKLVADIVLAKRVSRFMVSLKPQKQMPEGVVADSKSRQSVRIITPKEALKPNTKTTRSSVTGPNIDNPRSSVPKLPPPVSATAAKKESAAPIKADSLMVRRASLYSIVSQNTNSLKMPEISTTQRPSKPTTKDIQSSANLRDNRQRNNQNKSRGNVPTFHLPSLERNIWPGDPEAIGSVRRPRKNAQEMLTSYKIGEDSRRLRREMTMPCTRNCHKPNVISELGRIYMELPALIPDIDKAREDLLSRGDYPDSERRSADLLTLPPSALYRRSSSLGTRVTSSRQPSSTVHMPPVVQVHGTVLRDVTSVRH